MDDVADIEQANPGDAVERRGERCVAELDIGIVHRSLIALDLRFELIDRGLLVVELLARHGIPGDRDSAGRYADASDRG